MAVLLVFLISRNNISCDHFCQLFQYSEQNYVKFTYIDFKWIKE